MTTGGASGPVEFGILSLSTQPSEVDVWIDGELWPARVETERLILHLPPGRYFVALAKEGYLTFQTEVGVSSGETAALNVRMAPGSP